MFDVSTIGQLAAVMSEHDLSEIMLETEQGQLRLRRGPRGVISAMPMAMPQMQAAPAPATGQAPKAEAAKPARNLTEIKSEAIGTFYSRPNPDAEPFVRVGARITPNSVVGLIEAMKMFNEITAGCSGTIAEILVENQQAVEYGTVLFRVDPS